MKRNDSRMLFVVFALFFLFKDLNLVMATESPPKKWPCDQVYNPKLNSEYIENLRVSTAYVNGLYKHT